MFHEQNFANVGNFCSWNTKEYPNVKKFYIAKVKNINEAEYNIKVEKILNINSKYSNLLKIL